MRKPEDLTGQKFGKLTVISIHEKRGKFYTWKCVCDCGSGKIVYPFSSNLKRGKSKSCGCLVVGHEKTHGMTGTPEHKTWIKMRQRCLNPNDKEYPRYGGRGIKVCERWDDYLNFISDMGIRPSKDHSIERINNNGDYSPENCKWATRSEQANNRRTSKLIEYNGKFQTARQWSIELNIDYEKLTIRLDNGWNEVEALTVPMNLSKTQYFNSLKLKEKEDE